jgi:hypothetical protein
MMQDMPAFNCVERCQAPDEFFSGGPWLYHPKEKVLRLEKEQSGFIEWQIWEGLSTNSTSFVIEVDGNVILKVIS